MPLSSFTSPTLFKLVNLLLLLLFVLLNFLFFDKLILALFREFFRFLNNFINLTLQVGHCLYTILTNKNGLFRNKAIGAKIIAMGTRFLLIVIRLGMDVMFSPSLIFRSNGGSNLIVSWVLLLLTYRFCS